MKKDFWLMGEVIHGDYARWANPRLLHSVTNYELHKSIYSGFNDHNFFRLPITCAACRPLDGNFTPLWITTMRTVSPAS